jgi:hypothetical protein
LAFAVLLACWLAGLLLPFSSRALSLLKNGGPQCAADYKNIAPDPPFEGVNEWVDEPNVGVNTQACWTPGGDKNKNTS